MSQPDVKALEKRMEGAIGILKKEYSGLRTGRASASLLENIKVDAYGSLMPIEQVGSINVPEARLLSVQVWDQGLVSAVEKAIRDSGLGLNPAAEGQVIRINIPELTEERRQEIAKVAGKYAEEAKISVRNVRRSGMDEIKTLEKDGDISKDDHHKWSDRIQELTDSYVSNIDEMFSKKQKEIMQV